jgi:meiotic recombination protein REC8
MSSSSGPPGLPGSDQIHVDPIEQKLRGSSQSRRSSSLILSQAGSLAERFSPAPIRQSSQDLPEDYVFESMGIFTGVYDPLNCDCSGNARP